MPFPTSPVNNDITTLNGITYIYNSSPGRWTRVTSSLGNIGNIGVTNNANLTNVYGSVGSFTGNLSAAGIVGTTYYGQINLGTTSINLNRASASQVLTGVGIDGTAGTATNAINTQITSNISSGTAYVTFVSATSGNAAQNINTGFTYNPNTGNLRAYGIQTDTGVYWAGNGAAFASYGNTEITSNLATGFYGNIIPGSNVTYSLGSSTNRWKDLWVSGSTIYIGSEAISVGPTGQWSFTSNGGTIQLSSAETSLTGNITTNGWIIPTANVTQNIGTTTSWWGTFYGISTQAKYADLAENYQADNDYKPGTVLCFGGNVEVTVSTLSHDTTVAGVVSTNPAHLMNGALTGKNVIALALQGRVPCLVKGPVNKGTVLVTSDIPGVAESINYNLFKPGCILGKSLEQITDNSTKIIEVIVGRF